MADLACTYPECCTLPDCARPVNLLPYEYQGWFIVLFLFFATLAILYGFYLMAGENKNV